MTYGQSIYIKCKWDKLLSIFITNSTQLEHINRLNKLEIAKLEVFEEKGLELC